jgi:hypothetical protein
MDHDHLSKMKPGWLLPYLLALDTLDAPEQNYRGHGRWAYWMDACTRGVVPEGPIPQIRFRHQPDREDSKHVQEVLRIYVNQGYWYDDAWLALVRWLLHGFGREDLGDDVARIPPQVRNAWYERFNLGILLRSPIDWSAYVIQGGLPAMKSGQHRWAWSTGFFSTPMDICEMMALMTFGTGDPEMTKLQTVCDPCCGTGSMLLAASNYSLRLYGSDIVPDLCLCAELNGWLWAPWLVYMPRWMRDLFDARSERPAPAVAPIRLEVDPARVEATAAFRTGEMGQADFFAALGMQ